MKSAILVILSVLISTTNLTTYTVKKGEHDFKPNTLKLTFGDISCKYTVMFTEKSKYIIPNENQLDWNKGSGSSNELFTNFKNSAMWAWRWNTKKNVFQCTGYFHKNDKRYYAENYFSGKVFEIEPNHKFDVYFYKKTKQSQYQIMFRDMNSDNTVIYDMQYDNLKSWNRNIGAWFGGNEAAPSDVEIYFSKTNL